MRPEATLDIECFSNWFLIGITDHATGTQWDYQATYDMPLDVASVTMLARHYTFVTFHGVNYDLPMFMLALKGADCATLKQANDDIILRGLKWWQFYKKYDCYPPDWIDHIDVSEVAPGVRVSLKQYMCRMSSRLVQDTPVDFNAPLPLQHAPSEIYYCRNDRSGTNELRDIVDERLAVRRRMSERFGVDLRSKSDAQMAEAMVKAEWGRIMRDSIQRYEANPPTGVFPIDDFPHIALRNNYDVDYRGNPRPIIPRYSHGTTFKARIPAYIEFVTPYMREFLDIVRNCEFVISDKDEAIELGYDPAGVRTGVLMPPELKGRDIVIGQTTYRVGIGGLHSQESSVSYRSTPGVCTLRTVDVDAYYPSLIINTGMYPPQLGKLFLSIYKQFYDMRLHSKSEKKKHPKESAEYIEHHTIDTGFKIVNNGTFGKLFSRFSIFYAPELGIAVTIGGQLSLLMLIERLELSGIRVVSANTDGVELLVPHGYEGIANSVIAWWQSVTRLTMSGSPYLALYSRDVNNYVSLQFDGSVKRKGIFGESGVLNNKHPDCDICADAVVAFLTQRVPLETTILACQDIRRFVRVRGAKGGATWFRSAVDRVGERPVNNGDGTLDFSNTVKYLDGGEHLGRAVRWYYARGSTDHIVDTKSLNKVAGSDGARPVMELPDVLPSDIDYDWYISRAAEMLVDIGYGQENQK